MMSRGKNRLKRNVGRCERLDVIECNTELGCNNTKDKNTDAAWGWINDKKLADEQATHGTWIAGTVYALGLQEAPGHVKARCSEYRAVSQGMALLP
jgi:hypothetical protein